MEFGIREQARERRGDAGKKLRLLPLACRGLELGGYVETAKPRIKSVKELDQFSRCIFPAAVVTKIFKPLEGEDIGVSVHTRKSIRLRSTWLRRLFLIFAWDFYALLLIGRLGRCGGRRVEVDRPFSDVSVEARNRLI